MTTEYNSTLVIAAPPERPPSASPNASSSAPASQDKKAQNQNRLPEVQTPEPGAKPINNPNMWSAADLVLTQRTNALYPHPESQVAKELKAHSATQVYSQFSAVTSIR